MLHIANTTDQHARLSYDPRPGAHTQQALLIGAGQQVAIGTSSPVHADAIIADLRRFGAREIGEIETADAGFSGIVYATRQMDAEELRAWLHVSTHRDRINPMRNPVRRSAAT